MGLGLLTCAPVECNSVVSQIVEIGETVPDENAKNHGQNYQEQMNLMDLFHRH